MMVGGAGKLPARERIVEFLEQQPGATIRTVAKALGCAPQTASYHLGILIRRGIVDSRRDGRTQRHFVAGQARDPDALLAALLRDPKQAVVVRALSSEANTTWTINGLAQVSGESFRICKRVAERLAEIDMVSLERRRGCYILRPAQALMAERNPALTFGLVREGRIPDLLSYE